MRTILDSELAGFAEYLLANSLSREQHAKFYVYWVRRLARESKDWPDESWDIHLQRYVDLLSEDSQVQDWQVRQAERAVRLYYHNYCDGADGPRARAPAAVNEQNEVNRQDVLSTVREQLRVRHYSYRTEQTYLAWIDRFLQFGADRRDGGESGTLVRLSRQTPKRLPGMAGG
ncbi:MAG: phage integrase N-terminal SAM-like domain-containing protein [Kiritimatiellae bacterium]|nr:phage integrase N-terminal SAM-like domain-containing protein [Kiritimatiellia bacterium]